MKKKIFGIKIGTILMVVTCLMAAVVFWLFAKYTESGMTDTAMSVVYSGGSNEL